MSLENPSLSKTFFGHSFTKMQNHSFIVREALFAIALIKCSSIPLKKTLQLEKRFWVIALIK